MDLEHKKYFAEVAMKIMWYKLGPTLNLKCFLFRSAKNVKHLE